MTADNHIHTRFSPDGHNDPEDVILRALQLGAKHISFTEHVDLLYSDPDFVTHDPAQYMAYVRMLQQKYADRIYINVGLEVGYLPFAQDANRALLQKYNPDYIIHSIHEVNGKDCYFATYFEGKTVTEAYTQYLYAVRDSLAVDYPFHTVGHIGYVCRNSPYPDTLYATAPALVDEILQEIIHQGKILEINTSIRREGMPTLPERNVLERYVALGGKKICFSSDAHRPEDIFRKYDVFVDVATQLGIPHQTVIQNGKEMKIGF